MSNRLKIKLAFALLCFSTMCYAQGEKEVFGTLKRKSDSSPIEYASVALKNSKTKQIIDGVITDSTGHFALRNMRYGTYYLACSYVGCKEFDTRSFTIDIKHHKVDMGVITLEDGGKQIKDVVVSAKAMTYSSSIDRKIFNVGADISSSSGSASELMQNIPSVEVDMEGNVSLRGNTNVLILIDGRPSLTTKGSARANTLASLRASNIERIEVISNPSAQFAPDAAAGIINIITKKEKKAGLNGNIIANVGNSSRYNAGVLLNYATPKFNLWASYNYRHDYRNRTTDNKRTLRDSITNAPTSINQYTTSTAPSIYHVFGLGGGWNISKKDYLTASASLTHLSCLRTEDNKSSQQDSILRQYNRHRFDNETQNQAEANFSFVHTFAKDKTLSFNYTYSLQDETERNHYTNTYTLPQSYTTLDNTLIKQKNYENLLELIHEGQIDERNKIVVGAEAELDKSDMRYLASDYINSLWQTNTNKSNDFLFNERVYSFYATYSHSFGRLSIMAGARAEFSNIVSQLLTLNQQVTNNYANIYPSLHTTFQISKTIQAQLNYSLRINRPEGDDLNPFAEYQDPYNRRQGNPYLLPEKIHSFEFGLGLQKGDVNLTLTPYYRICTNKMTQITRSLANGVMLTTKENLSKR